MVENTIKKLVLANKMLSNEGILDAFGHVSARHPENPDLYLLSRSKSPSIVTEDDIMTHDFDGNVLDKDYKPYMERVLHAQIFKARPDVKAICHNHATSLIPFTTTGVEVKPIIHIGGMFYEGVPVFDDGDVSSGMLIMNPKEAERVARTLGNKRALLLRGHGVVVVGSSLEEVVMSSIYLATNAEIQYRSMMLGSPKYLSYEEGRAAMEVMFGPVPLERAWGYWADRVEKSH